jgi:aspartate 1-decarboxylase
MLKNQQRLNFIMAPIRWLLRSKIHRATVTQADLDYVGSISIDEELMEESGIVEWEKITVLDVTNGSRLETYAIKAPRGSGEICINGAAAHLVNPGDLVILLTYQGVEEGEIENHQPRIVHVDEQNKIIELVTTESNY